jgi:heptosyltransferase III
VSIQRVTVYRCGALGDTIVMLPLIRAIREHLRCAVTLIASRASGELGHGSEHADRLVDGDSAIVSRWLAGDVDAARECLGCSDVLLFFGSRDDAMAIAAREAGVGDVRVFPVLPPRMDVHVIDHALSALDDYGVHCRGVSPQIVVGPEIAGAVDDALRQVGIGRNGRFAVVHAGSSAPGRCYPEIARVALLIEEELGLPVVVNVGPVEAERETIREWQNPRRVTGPHTPGVLAGIIARAALYVGNDTGPTHLAAAVGAPTVAVFGPESLSVVWSPRGQRVKVVRGADSWPTVADVLAMVREIVGNR